MYTEINDFGTRLFNARRNKNLTQEQLSQMIDVSRQAIYDYEKGKYYPRIDNAAKLAKILDVDLYYLCFGEIKRNNFDYELTYKDVMSFLISLKDTNLFSKKIVDDGKRKKLVITSSDDYLISLEEQIKSVLNIKGSLNKETYQRSLEEVLNSYDIAIKSKK